MGKVHMDQFKKLREEVSRLDKVKVGSVDQSNYSQYLQIINELFFVEDVGKGIREEAYSSMLEIIQTCSLPKECSAEIAKIPISCFISGIEGIIKRMLCNYRYGNFDRSIYYKKREITAELYKALSDAYVSDIINKHPCIENICSKIIIYLQLCRNRSITQKVDLEKIIDFDFMRHVVLILKNIYD